MNGFGQRLAGIFPVLLLAILAGLTYWLEQAVQSPPQTREKPLAHSPDFTVEKLLATRMDVNGRIRDSLQTAKMTHFADDDSTDLESPRFVSFSRGVPLSISAKQGTVSSNGGNLYFRDNVVATRGARKGTSALVVSTDYLHILPDDNIAKTDQPVTIRDANMEIEAQGMELNDETGVLKMNGGVKGVFYEAKTVSASPSGNRKR